MTSSRRPRRSRGRSESHWSVRPSSRRRRRRCEGLLGVPRAAVASVERLREPREPLSRSLARRGLRTRSVSRKSASVRRCFARALSSLLGLLSAWLGMLSSHREPLSPKLGTLSPCRQTLSVLLEPPTSLREQLRAHREPLPEVRAPPAARHDAPARIAPVPTPVQTSDASLETRKRWRSWRIAARLRRCTQARTVGGPLDRASHPGPSVLRPSDRPFRGGLNSRSVLRE